MPAKSASTIEAPSQASHSYTVTNNPPSPKEYTDGVSVWSYSERNYRGWSIPDFHRKLKTGELLPYTPWKQYTSDSSREFSLHVVDHAYSPDSYWDQLSGNWKGIDNNISGTWNWRITEQQLADVAGRFSSDPYVQAAAAKIYSSGHDTLTLLAEIHKVKALFTSAVNSLYRLYNGDFARSWLQYRYGWRILYYDLVEIWDTLARLDRNRKRFTERTGTSLHFNEDVGDIVVTSHPWTCTIIGDVSYDVSIRGSVTADIEPPHFQFNPVITGWELVTFSFIIDWFVDIGSWLASLSFLVFNTDYRAGASVLVKAHQNTVLSGMTRPGYSDTGSTASSTSEAEYVVRTPTTVGIQIPSVIIDVLDESKVFDLMALVYGGKPSPGQRI